MVVDKATVVSMVGSLEYWNKVFEREDMFFKKREIKLAEYWRKRIEKEHFFGMSEMELELTFSFFTAVYERKFFTAKVLWIELSRKR